MIVASAKSAVDGASDLPCRQWLGLEPVVVQLFRDLRVYDSVRKSRLLQFIMSTLNEAGCGLVVIRQYFIDQASSIEWRQFAMPTQVFDQFGRRIGGEHVAHYVECEV